ncbi:MAG TPA: rhodanese-like domain-containing protein [Rubrivivax sp.]|nr:rhodanese-like domain-containing protein [Rubrivivax sp.]
MGILAMFRPSTGEERTQILYRAFSRSGGKPRSYAGYVTPQEAQRLMELGAARIVDLRTAFEREYVGHVPGTLHVEWLALGAAEPHAGFVDALRAVAEPQDTLVFLCRSGKRSDAAATAAAVAGFGHVLNVMGGFEGDLDSGGQRGRLGGWRKAGLPWVQG